MKALLLLLGTIVCLMAISQKSCGQQVTNSRELLNEALNNIGGEDGWRSKAAEGELQEIIERYPTSAEFTTATALYVSCLTEQGGDESYKKALVLVDAVFSKNQLTWQTMLVLLDKAVILSFQNKNQEALTVAQEGLSMMEKEGLDNCADPDFKRLEAAIGAKRSQIKDGFLALIATCFIKLGFPEKAGSFIDQIQNSRARESVEEFKKASK